MTALVVAGLAAAALALYAIGGALLFFKQRSILYPVSYLSKRVDPPPPPFRGENIATPDGETLRAWYAPPPAGAATLLVLHGNGDTLEGLAPRLFAFAALGHGVLALQFRGYPGSTGAPTETGLTVDAFASYDWLIAQGVAENRIALFGRSLGTGLAIKIAAARKPGALILEAPYTSIAAVARAQFPIYPAALLRDPYRSTDHLAAVRAPLLIIHGDADGLVPPAMAVAVRDLAGSPDKTLHLVAGGGHNDLDAHGLVEMVHAFLLRTIQP